MLVAPATPDQPTTPRLELSHKQARFFFSPAPRLLYAGAWRSQKTVALGAKLVWRASHPGAVEFIGRKHLRYLQKSTIPTILRGTTTTPPLLPPGTYTHNKAEGIIRIKGGGEIWYGPMDDFTKFGGTEFTGAGVDEVSDLESEEWWYTLEGRCSRKIDGLPRQVYGACNPSHPHHWLAKMFGINRQYTPMPGTDLIETSMLDNKWLSREYVDQMRALTGMMYRRYVLGEWVAADGLVYGCWSREKHLLTTPKNHAWKRAFIGVDDGYMDPFCALLGLEDHNGKVWIVAERYGPGYDELTRVGHVRYLADLARKIKVPLVRVVVDYAGGGASLIAKLQEAGLPAQAANKSVEDGISAARSRFEAQTLAIDPVCKNLVQELECYTYDPKKPTRPKDGNDHGPDAMRYLVIAIGGNGVVGVFGDQRKRRAGLYPPSHRMSLSIMGGTVHERTLKLMQRDLSSLRATSDPRGPLCVWEMPSKGAKYVIGIAGGDAPASSHAVVIDTATTRVIAEMEAKPGQNAAEAFAALILWCGVDDTIASVMATTTAGQVLANQLAELGLPMSGFRDGWRPTEKQAAEAIVGVRLAWEQERIFDPSSAADVDAAWYQWTGTRPEPARVREDPQLRMVWADRIMARAAAMKLMAYAQPSPPEYVEDPITRRRLPVLSQFRTPRVH